MFAAMSQQQSKPKQKWICGLVAIIIVAACSKQTPKPPKAKLNVAYDQAVAFRDNENADSAYLYFDKAKDVFLAAQDSLGVGKCLLNMAILSSDKGDVYGGQELSLNAIQYFNKNDTTQHIYIQSNLNNLGNSCYLLEAYDRAAAFFNEALLYTSDEATRLILQNNIANAHRRKGDYQKALAFYALVLKNNLSEADYARALSNMAYTKWLQDSTYNANPELERGLRIREQIGNKQQQIASLNYLVEVNQSDDRARALAYALRMHNTAQQINNPTDRLEALQKLVDLSSGNTLKTYFKSYKRLSDSIQMVRNAAKNQFALIRYESEKRKTENLQLQQLNVEQTYKVAVRDLLILLGTLVFIASAIIAVLWFRKRKARMIAEKQHEIQEHQLKTSKRVHDVVANGLYRVITEIDNDLDLNKEEILDKLELMYEKSRDISYDIPTALADAEGFNHKIDKLLKSFATSTTSITITGNTAAYWIDIPGNVQYELEHVLQELMVNMKKHSHATNVLLNFERGADHASISYQDNGKGIDAGRKQGNGLKNTGSRIKSIDGEITFDSPPEGGLKIKLFFPSNTPI